MPSPTNRKRSKARRKALISIDRLLVLFAAILVFAAVLVLDPAGVTRLVWLCLTGAMGTSLQVATLVGLLTLLAAMAWAFKPIPARSGNNRRKSTANRRQVSKTASAKAPRKRQ